MRLPLITVQIRYEHDVVLARQRARLIAEHLGVGRQDQVQLATAVSELARNVFQYARQGKTEFLLERRGSSNVLFIVVSDHGPGIANLSSILDGTYVSKTGMGVGLTGARRLMDHFHIDSRVGEGTTVTVGTNLPEGPPISQATLKKLLDRLAIPASQDPFAEIQRQNQELLVAMEDLRARQEELAQLNRELEDTNRGVVALYAELDEKADYLRRASEIKTRFLSNMTHEFRTPLNSILSLSRILLEKLDGPLTVEQGKQVSFIRRAATELSEIVNDLLDLSKVEAGKIVIRPVDFEIVDLFGALRGMLRPLLAHNSAINLNFVEPVGIPPIHTDESKLSQILRNFISNAIKFTEEGEVRVEAALQEDKTLRISVTDTGIGIAPHDQGRIFEEFTQVDGPQQRRVKGTGLGLPLAKKLAELLGGSVTLTSEVGVGSTFAVTLPMAYHGSTEVTYIPEIVRSITSTHLPVLVLDDNTETLFIYERFLKGTRYQAVAARTIKEARAILANCRPVAIVLDILLERENTWSFLSELKQGEETRRIPVFVVTMVENKEKALRSGADAFHLKPLSRDWLLERLRLAAQDAPAPVLIIDNDEVARYIFRGLLAESDYPIFEASGGHDGLEVAAELRPGIIFLDLNMPDLHGSDVLERLKADPATRDIPVVIYTSQRVTAEERLALGAAAAILSKDDASREHATSALLDTIAEVTAGKARRVTTHG